MHIFFVEWCTIQNWFFIESEFKLVIPSVCRIAIQMSKEEEFKWYEIQKSWTVLFNKESKINENKRWMLDLTKPFWNFCWMVGWILFQFNFRIFKYTFFCTTPPFPLFQMPVLFHHRDVCNFLRWPLVQSHPGFKRSVPSSPFTLIGGDGPFAYHYLATIEIERTQSHLPINPV